MEADTIKQVEMKDKIENEYLRRTRKLLETKLSCLNLIKGINTWAVVFVRYSRPFLKGTRDELKQMDQRTRKLMTMHKALHRRDDVDGLYVSRKNRGRGLASSKDSVVASIQRLEDCIEKHEGGLITAIRNYTDDTMDNNFTIWKQKWEGKQLYGHLKTTNEQHLRRENLDQAKKRKFEVRNRTSPNSSTKQHRKKLSYQSENR